MKLLIELWMGGYSNNLSRAFLIHCAFTIDLTTSNNDVFVFEITAIFKMTKLTLSMIETRLSYAYRIQWAPVKTTPGVISDAPPRKACGSKSGSGLFL